MRLIHSADWQMGMRFRQFGAQAEALRAVRVKTLRRALDHARRVKADAFLIAGDLFEDNQVDLTGVAEVFGLLAEYSEVPIVVLPGNHDPCDGPGSIWARPPFAQPPAHLTVVRQALAMDLGKGYLVANPLTQKRSTVDPTLRLAELAADLPQGAIKVGLTHGSPAIESQHQADDFPIALEAATRARLDYLAIGHWHSALSLDGGRLMMAGTPEPTSFTEKNAGCVQEVKITAAGALPEVTPVPVGELTWQSWRLNLSEGESGRAVLAAQRAALGEAAKGVVRVTLEGEAASGTAVLAEEWVKELLAACFSVQVVDQSTLSLSAGELLDLQSRHPLLAGVLEELGALGEGRLSALDLQALSARTGLPLEAFNASVSAAAQRALLGTLREVTGA